MGRIGNLTIKKTKSHGATYEYYYVQHYIKETDKIEWCYLGSYNKLTQEYKDKLKKNNRNERTNYTQNCTQTNTETEKPKTSSKSQNRSGRSLAWSRTSASQAGDPGSNPGDRTTKWHFHANVAINVMVKGAIRLSIKPLKKAVIIVSEPL